MNYRLQTRKKNRNPVPKILLIIIVAVIVSVLAGGLIVKTFTYTVGVFSNIISFVIPKGFRSNSSVLEENESLRQEVLKLAAENADRNFLKSENNNLKFLLNRGIEDEGNEGAILSFVLSKPSDTPYDTFILDVGLERGVEVNDSVTFGSLAIGSIVEVGNKFSKAKLFSSFGNVFSGTLGDNNLKVEVKGLGGGSFESLVPIGASVKKGDALVMTQIDTKVYGVVQEIEELTDEGFKRLFFVMPVNINQIKEVLIQR